MKNIYKIGVVFLLTGLSSGVFSQNEWIGKLTLNSLDCENQKACYILEVKNPNDEPWVLGDQNYRLFFDAENISIESVKSLLPLGYSSAAVNEVLELVGKGQEDFSPLDEIDSNLGFLDFSIISYLKYTPSEGVKVTENYQSVAEICLNLAEEMITQTGEEHAINIYFCRAETAGKITRQFSLISESVPPNRTVKTTASQFYDLNHASGMDARLGEFCKGLTNTGELSGEELEALKKGKISVFPNPAFQDGTISYEVAGIDLGEHSITITDINNRVIMTYKNLSKTNRQIKLGGTEASGVYFLKIRTKTDLFHEEFVILRD